MEGPEQQPDGTHHARALGDRRARRRHVQRRRSDRQPLGLQHARAESAWAAWIRRRACARPSRRRAPPGQPRLRYNWIAPIALSPHNPQIVYAGAQVLFRSLNRGDTWEEISPDLTTNDPDEDRAERSRTARSRRSRSRRCSAGIIWVGTDDGKVQLTQNHGGAWTDVDAGADGRRRDRPIAGSAACSRPRTTRARRSSRRAASAMTTSRRTCIKTTDFGKTWTAISRQPAERADQRRRAGPEESAICSSSATTSACSSRSMAAACGRG